MTGLLGAALIGATVAVALWSAWRALYPAPMPLSAARARLNRRSELIAEDTQGVASVRRRLGSWLGPTLEGMGLDLEHVRADARVVGISLNEHLGSKITSALVGPALALVLTIVCLAAGVDVPVFVFAVLAVVLAVIGFVGSDPYLHREAERRRRDFVTAFSSYLDLVAISMEGGVGWNGALVEAARIGDSRPFEMLRAAIDTSNFNARPVWEGFDQLATELNIPALATLSANITLAGRDGARVRSSIAGRADTLRQEQLVAIETAEAAATQKLTMPTVMLLIGFAVLLGFPAMYAIATGV